MRHLLSHLRPPTCNAFAFKYTPHRAVTHRSCLNTPPFSAYARSALLTPFIAQDVERRLSSTQAQEFHPPSAAAYLPKMRHL